MKPSDQLKHKLFGIEQYNDIIVNFRTQIENFGSHQKRLLRNGRYNKFYSELDECVYRKMGRKDEKESCLK